MPKTIEIPNKVTQEIYRETKDLDPNAPVIKPEDLYGKGVGRFTTPLTDLWSWSSSPIFDKYFNVLNIPEKDIYGSSTSAKLSRDLHNNNFESLIRVPGHTQAVSVFYTIDPKNQLFHIDWGKIDPDSKECKQHDSIRRAINYYDRVAQKMSVFSGHMASISESPHYFALIDAIADGRNVPLTEKEKHLINMLHNLNFFPLRTDGKMLLPQFI